MDAASCSAQTGGSSVLLVVSRVRAYKERSSTVGCRPIVLMHSGSNRRLGYLKRPEH
jgi:hypothetical protein